MRAIVALTAQNTNSSTDIYTVKIAHRTFQRCCHVCGFVRTFANPSTDHTTQTKSATVLTQLKSQYYGFIHIE